METEKKFSKEKWLESANEQLAQGYITQQDIDNACETWVNDMDGKALSGIEEDGNPLLNEAWFV